MADKAAIVTGASSGIGLAIADVLGQEGHGLTVAARRPDKLEAAAEGLRAKGYEVEVVAGNLADEEVVRQVVAAHRERFGRLDVLVNNAGVGVGATVAELNTKRVDLQLDLNLRSPILFYRETRRPAQGGRRRAPQRARRQHRVDLGQARRGVAVGVLGHEARRGGLHRGDEQGAQRRGRQVVRAVPRLRRHGDDGLRQGARSRPRT